MGPFFEFAAQDRVGEFVVQALLDENAESDAGQSRIARGYPNQNAMPDLSLSVMFAPLVAIGVEIIRGMVGSTV